MFTRKLEVGDIIILGSSKIVIKEILNQDAYIGEDVPEDKKHINIKFINSKGKVVSWNSSKHGGHVGYKVRSSNNKEFGYNYIVSFNGKEIKLSEICSSNLDSLATYIAKDADIDYKEIPFDISIYESDGIVTTCIFESGILIKQNNIPISNVSKESLNGLYSSLYFTIKRLNRHKIVADEISFRVIPGGKWIEEGLNVKNKFFYERGKIVDLVAKSYN